MQRRGQEGLKGICREGEGGAKGREGYAEKGKGGKGRLMLKVILRLESVVIILTFFLSVGWLNRFGSIRFGSIGF